jgi:hypothetical protein
MRSRLSAKGRRARSPCARRLSHKPPASSLDPFSGWAPKTAISSVADGPSVPRSSRTVALACTSAPAQRRFRNGFVRQPPRGAAPAASRSGASARRRAELAGNRHPNVGSPYWAPGRGEGILSQPALDRPERKRRYAWTPIDKARGCGVGRAARARGRGARPRPRAGDPAHQRRDRNRSGEGALVRRDRIRPPAGPPFAFTETAPGGRGDRRCPLTGPSPHHEAAHRRRRRRQRRRPKQPRLDHPDPLAPGANRGSRAAVCAAPDLRRRAWSCRRREVR